MSLLSGGPEEERRGHELPEPFVHRITMSTIVKLILVDILWTLFPFLLSEEKGKREGPQALPRADH